MRQIFLPTLPNQNDDALFRSWVQACMTEIFNASTDDPTLIANDYTVQNHTATRTLDASTAVLADVIDVVCTLIEDLQNRGTKRSQ